MLAQPTLAPERPEMSRVFFVQLIEGARPSNGSAKNRPFDFCASKHDGGFSRQEYLLLDQSLLPIAIEAYLVLLMTQMVRAWAFMSHMPVVEGFGKLTMVTKPHKDFLRA
jgi:hypothetical protein